MRVIKILKLIIQTVLLSMVAIVMFSCASIDMIPMWVVWQKKEIVFDDEDIHDSSNDSDIEYAYLDKEIDSFRVKEIKKIILHKKKLLIYDKNDDVVWETPKEYKVQDFLWEDIDRDNEPELILLLWKKGKFGPYMPFYIKENDMKWDNHIFIYDYVNGYLKSRWKASYIEAEANKMTFDKDTKILTLTHKDGVRSRYAWLSWGIQNIAPSKFDYNKKFDRYIDHLNVEDGYVRNSDSWGNNTFVYIDKYNNDIKKQLIEYKRINNLFFALRYDGDITEEVEKEIFEIGVDLLIEDNTDRRVIKDGTGKEMLIIDKNTNMEVLKTSSGIKYAEE